MSQAQPSQTHQEAPVTHETIQQVPLQAAGIEERLQHLANSINIIGIATTFSSTPSIYLSTK